MNSEHEAAPDPRELVHQHDDEHGHTHGHGGTGKYWMVFFALCVLTGFSFMTYFDFWHKNIPEPVSRAFMMAVSCTKALLVMSFFMHLIWEANWKYVLTIPAGMMSIFLMLMLVPDVGCRFATYSKDRLTHSAEPRAGGHGHDGHGHGDAGGSHGGAHPDPLNRGRTDRGQADDHEHGAGETPAPNHSHEGEDLDHSHDGANNSSAGGENN